MEAPEELVVEDDDDKYMEMINFASIRTINGLEEAITLQWPESDRALRLTTLLGQDDIAPLFAGAQWAGTRVWHAAVIMFQYLTENYKEKLEAEGTTVLELGCGLGVPGMWCRQVHGCRTYLTDQESILSQLEANLETNFSGDDGILARPLDWSKEALQQFINKENITAFDIVLNCDCVYEPLYGDSWKLLADVNEEVIRLNPSTLVLTSVERRNADSVDKFIDRMRASELIGAVDLVWSDPEVRIEIYLTSPAI